MTKINMMGDARERYYHSISSKVSIIFGASMLIYCLLIIHQRLSSQIYDSVLVMTFFTLILVFVIFLNKKRSILSTMGLYSLGMAMTRLPAAITYIFNPRPTFMFLVGIVFLVIALNMLYSAWQYLHGICRGYITNTVITFILWLLYTGGLVACLTGVMPDFSGTVVAKVLDGEVFLANVILFTVYLIVLGTDEIRDSCEMEMAVSQFDSIRSVCDSGHDSSVSRADARKIVAGPSQWNKVDFGPIEYEYRFIVSYTDRAQFGTIQKWKDDDTFYITISHNIWGKTMVEATRFQADEISCDTGDVETCSFLHFRSKNGDCDCIEVLDDNMDVML